jgi:hypothetical protein
VARSGFWLCWRGIVVVLQVQTHEISEVIIGAEADQRHARVRGYETKEASESKKCV